MADFLDRLKQGVGKGVTTVSVKSREALDVARLRSAIADSQNRKKTALEELGNIAYTMHLNGSFDEERLHTVSAAIGDLDEEIQRKQGELAETHAKAQEALGKPRPVGVCACGASIYERDKFCGRCGRKTEAALRNADDPNTEEGNGS